MNRLPNLILDSMSGIYPFLKSWRTHEFWDLKEHDVIPNSLYVIGRKQTTDNIEKIRDMAYRNDTCVVFENSAEGSWTLISQLQAMGLDDLVLAKKLLLISGGDMATDYPHIKYEHFISCIVDYDENIDAMRHIDSIFDTPQKPHTFLFLNGRSRAHRKYLWHQFNKLGLLDQALWTMLDSRPAGYRHFKLVEDNINILANGTPLKWLPTKYEIDQFHNPKITVGPGEQSNIKFDLFNNIWGEIYLNPAPYRDTYFSVVTETVYEYPYTFCTEKIAKPLAQGHPWIVAANQGFYRDVRNMGFKTFDGIIDESFDQIDNHQQRMDRIIQVVGDLCQQDLPAFLAACKPVCKYNQQHLVELASRYKNEFPDRFFKFVNQYE